MRATSWVMSGLLAAMCVCIPGLSSGCEESGPVGNVSTDPPKDAKIIVEDVDQEHVLFGRPSPMMIEKGVPLTSYEGMWIHKYGWIGTIADITNEKDGTALRIAYTASGGVLGGTYFVIAIVPERDLPYSKGDQVTYTGRIAKIEEVPAGTMPTKRIVVDHAKVLKPH